MAVIFCIDEYNVLHVGDREFFVQSIAGQVHLLSSRCPHRGGPLRLGRVENGQIVCPWHGTRVALSHCAKAALPVVFRRHSKSILVAEEAPHGTAKRFRWTVRV